jgi:hypothetical protein
MMNQEAKDVMFFFGGFALICTSALVIIFWAAKPSPMQHCIRAGYEWIDGDCVKGDGK